MTRFIGWVLDDIEGHAHIIAISDTGTVVMREWTRNEWRAWGRQTFNEGSIQIQNAIQSWERRGYERSEPVTIEILGDSIDLADGYQRPDREWMDRLFEPFLDKAGIVPPEPAVSTITSARLAAVSFTAGPPPGAAVGDIWIDTSADSTYVYNGGSWNTVEGIA